MLTNKSLENYGQNLKKNSAGNYQVLRHRLSFKLESDIPKNHFLWTFLNVSCMYKLIVYQVFPLRIVRLDIISQMLLSLKKNKGKENFM